MRESSQARPGPGIPSQNHWRSTRFFLAKMGMLIFAFGEVLLHVERWMQETCDQGRVLKSFKLCPRMKMVGVNESLILEACLS